MSTKRSADRWASRAGFGLGAAGAVAFVLSSAVPAAPVGHALELRVVANLTGRLDVRPFGSFVRADALRAVPGHNQALGRTAITNQTARPLTLRLRALPSEGGLDRVLRVAVSVGGRAVADTTLGGLRAFTRTPVVLPPNQASELVVRAWLPPGTPRRAYAGRTLDVPLEFQTDFAPKDAAR
ncbi:MAG TPA: hypothetical protein VGJ32_03260 [Solirubrobacteraceae bacterium]